VCGHCGDEVLGPIHWLLGGIYGQQTRMANRLAQVLARLEDRSNRVDEQQSGSRSDEGRRPLIGPAELAAELGRSPDWCRRNYELLGGKRTGSGPKRRYYFDLDRARECLFAHQESNGSSEEPAPKQHHHRRRRSSSGATSLLPIKTERAA
jgi:hypothetical protein